MKTSGRFGERREGARDEGDAEGAAGQPLGVEGDELDGDGDAEGGDGEIVGAQPQGDRADDARAKRRGKHGADPADRDRQSEAAEAACRSRRRQQRRGVGADRDEAGDADIEEAGLAPLEVEAEADDARR